MVREIVLLAIGAVFGLGATMAALAAPSHFPNAPPWIWHWLFWSGVALMALMISDAACLLFWRPRLVAAVLANLGLFICASAVIAQFSPPYRSGYVRGASLSYLHQRDSELGSSIINMARHSAWGRWYAAQLLVNSGERVGEQYLYQTAAGIVMDEIVNGNLEVRGRRPDPKQLGYELIDRTHWRSSWFACVHDPFAIWKIKLVPKGTVEIDGAGNVVRSDSANATQRTSLLDYDSFTVDGYQFEGLWPVKERLADKARRKLLCKARWQRLDKDEIRRLS